MIKPVGSVRLRQFIVRFAICMAILAGGAGSMWALASMRQEPAEAVRMERPVPVEAILAEPEDVQVIISEHGVVRPRHIVRVVPEVSGVVMAVHPRLDAGEVIPAGELLFEIDPRDYEAGVASAEANLALLRTQVERVRTEYANDRARLETITRSRELARNEFDRLHSLYHEDEVGTRSQVDGAERAYNQAKDAADQMQQALAVYPIRIREIESQARAAEASLQQARTALERTRVLAPFDARIKELSVQRGQFVAPGNPVLTLADDSILEISVPIDSRMARRWMRFNGEVQAGAGAAWFTALEDMPCTIRWTEDPDGHVWTGRLDRVERFDEQTRTLTVAVRIGGDEAQSPRIGAMPLVEGMFCRVEIPGRMLERVVPLPHWAVSYTNTVFIAGPDSRLRTVPVEVAHKQGDFAYVSEGIAPGDSVIVTRLIDPLENTLLDVSFAEPAAPIDIEFATAVDAAE
jgi:multidrug efflux system membrane fusion protein